MQSKIIFFSLYFSLLFLISTNGQTILTGRVTDTFTGAGIPDVEIIETHSDILYHTDNQGFFNLNISSEKGTLVFTKEGYYEKKIAFKQSQKLGNISMIAESILLDEVAIHTENLKNKVSPILTQNIPVNQFKEQVSHGELVTGLKSIPSVYITGQGGGSGDSKITIRGFDPAQTTVLINNISVNDMETGWVYWSNWSALSDVANTIDVQTGMGNKNIPLSTFGGTISINTFQDNKHSFSDFKTVFGNNLNLQTSILHHMYNAKNKSSFTAFLGRNSTDGRIEGTKALSNTYYFDFSKKIDHHLFQFSIFGAPQWHQQRSNYTYHMATLGDYLKYGTNYNYNFGYFNGNSFTWTENYFHKNLINLKWTWQMDNTQKLETTLYGSVATGGASYEAGNTPEGIFPQSELWRNTDNGHVMWDKINAYNSGENVVLSDGNSYQRADQSAVFTYNNMPFNAGLTKIAFTNKHHWLGGILAYHKTLSSHINLNFDYHFRYTHADNFDRLVDLLGADAFITLYDQNNFGKAYQKTNPITINSAWNLLKKPDAYDKLDFYYQAKILLHSFSGGMNFEQNKWNFFTHFTVSTQQNQRTDFFNYTFQDAQRTSKWVNQTGYSVLAGTKFSSQKNAWFFNMGYLQKPNRFESIFLNYKNDVNPQLQPEKAFSTELSYQLKSTKSLINMNLYHTIWMDKYTSLAYENPETHQTGTAFLNGVNQRHVGIELQWQYKITEKWNFNSMFSWGNWEYYGKASGEAFDFAQQNIGNLTLNLNHVKVGDAAQVSSFTQLNFQPDSHWKIFVNHQWISKLYSQLNMNQTFEEAIQLPNYQLVDIGLDALIYQSEKVKLNMDFSIQNLFDEMYIAESHTNYTSENDAENWHGIALNNKVFFGMGRTWRLGLNFRF